jgi:hypothetical protein
VKEMIKKGSQVATLKFESVFGDHLYIYVYIDEKRENLYKSYDRDGVEWCPILNCHIDYCPYHKGCRTCPEADEFLEIDGVVIPVRRIKL